VNWFELGSGVARLVDLPGYGFAMGDEQRRSEWHALMREYLRTRAQQRVLRRVCVLIDARVGLKESDREMMELLEQNRVQFHVVLTKCDAVSRVDLGRRFLLCAGAVEGRGQYVAPLMGCSARDGAGLAWVRAVLAAALPRPAKTK